MTKYMDNYSLVIYEGSDMPSERISSDVSIGYVSLEPNNGKRNVFAIIKSSINVFIGEIIS